ncbi:MAG TPA: cytochrome ubiquinol oxidase subunit I, partial [Gemmatimonadaceae bacterium]|nr:cytochrome ubiquinol oxidase subunit I [Gemmatimonadaceae bacterium]
MATTAVQTPAYAADYPGEHNGLWAWLTTVDHKRIGVLYLYTALGFFVFGGIEAVVIRIQLGAPNQHVVSAE